MLTENDKDRMLAAKDRTIKALESTIHQMWLRAGRLELEILELKKNNVDSENQSTDPKRPYER